KTSKNRTFMYDCLETLEKKGLVSHYIETNKKFFRAANPEQLYSVLDEEQKVQEQIMNEKCSSIKKLIPDLAKLQKPKGALPYVELFSTKKGIKTVLNLVLREKVDLFVYGSILAFRDIMEHYYDIWNKQRKGIATHVLTPEILQLPHAETEYFSDDYRTNTTTFTFGNKIIEILWGQVPVAILIESAE
ncbi:hypothetical protein GOV10_04810, partial [Candidatus Woesearchaeota archaeon]|nr:hypothetical protein [Candidatus Woesearchaeota archaeon]